MIPALFIGGPLDGQHCEIQPKQEQIQVMIQPEIEAVGPQNDKINHPTPIDVFYYKRETLNCPSKIYTLYVPRTFSCEDTIDALLQGYRAGPGKTTR